MIPESDKISLAHVHAYVDAQLSDEQCERMEDYFDANPDKFELLQRYLSINDYFQSIYNPVLQEEIPPVLLEGVLSSSDDPFRSPDNRLSRLRYFLWRVWFEKPALSIVWKGGLVGVPWIHRLGNRPGRRKLGSLIVHDKFPLAGVIGKIQRSLKPCWLRMENWSKPLLARAQPMLSNVANSYREVNLFAAVSFAAAGFVIGMSRPESPGSGHEMLASPGYAQSQAIQAHMYYRYDGRHALETDAEKQKQLLTWLSRRSGKEIRLIDFTELGYSSAGMALLPTKDNFALVTVYENDQRRKATLYIGLRQAGNRNDITCMSLEIAKSLCSWANEKMLFAVVSDFAVAETRQMAEWMKKSIPSFT